MSEEVVRDLSRRTSFPMLGCETESELMDQVWWLEVTIFLNQNRHPHCQCCGAKASKALATRVDEDTYLGMYPGNIATLCVECFNKHSEDKSNLVRALLKNSFFSSEPALWKSRHKRDNRLKHGLITLVHDARKPRS